jgi:hypothetical protein
VPSGLALKKILHFAHTSLFCVLCGFENKQRFLPFAALPD